MINLITLSHGTAQPADSLRYRIGHSALRTASGRKPIVVWNITRRCNQKCVHREWQAVGQSREVLTVNQPAYGPYLWMRLAKRPPERADAAMKLMRWNGGGAHGSGVGIANIDTQGNVHPDQFWQTLTLGNVREQPFSESWTQSDNPVLQGLHNRRPLAKGAMREMLLAAHPWRRHSCSGHSALQRSLAEGSRLLSERRGDRALIRQ